MNQASEQHTQNWHLRYRSCDFNPKEIFKDSNTKKEILFSLSFFLTVMSIEILFNQPFKKKIGIFHNKFYKTIFSKSFEKIERIEINSFAFSLFLILQRLFEEEENLRKDAKQIIGNVTTHWAFIENINKNNKSIRLDNILLLWEENKKIILSRSYEARIDLIFALYKSFEIGVSDKKIIKKNISVLIFSVSKAQKEFRFDVLNELKKKRL